MSHCSETKGIVVSGLGIFLILVAVVIAVVAGLLYLKNRPRPSVRVGEPNIGLPRTTTATPLRPSTLGSQARGVSGKLPDGTRVTVYPSQRYASHSTHHRYYHDGSRVGGVFFPEGYYLHPLSDLYDIELCDENDTPSRYDSGVGVMPVPVADAPDLHDDDATPDSGDSAYGASYDSGNTPDPSGAGSTSNTSSGWAAPDTSSSGWSSAPSTPPDSGSGPSGGGVGGDGGS